MRILLLAAVLAWSSSAAAAAEPAATLPTPYTADQIRDAWSKGLTIVVRTTDEKGVSFMRHEVTGWSDEGMEMASVPVDATGAAQGEPHVMNAKWTELLEHGRFPAASATRRRVAQETALGRLRGWLYRVKQDDGTTAIYFFPDSTPGMPVVFGAKRGSSWISKNEQISRKHPKG